LDSQFYGWGWKKVSKENLNVKNIFCPKHVLRVGGDALPCACFKARKPPAVSQCFSLQIFIQKVLYRAFYRDAVGHACLSAQKTWGQF